MKQCQLQKQSKVNQKQIIFRQHKTRLSIIMTQQQQKQNGTVSQMQQAQTSLAANISRAVIQTSASGPANLANQTAKKLAGVHLPSGSAQKQPPAFVHDKQMHQRMSATKNRTAPSSSGHPDNLPQAGVNVTNQHMLRQNPKFYSHRRGPEGGEPSTANGQRMGHAQPQYSAHLLSNNGQAGNGTLPSAVVINSQTLNQSALSKQYELNPMRINIQKLVLSNLIQVQQANANGSALQTPSQQQLQAVNNGTLVAEASQGQFMPVINQRNYKGTHQQQQSHYSGMGGASTAWTNQSHQHQQRSQSNDFQLRRDKDDAGQVALPGTILQNQQSPFQFKKQASNIFEAASNSHNVLAPGSLNAGDSLLSKFISGSTIKKKKIYSTPGAATSSKAPGVVVSGQAALFPQSKGTQQSPGPSQSLRSGSGSVFTGGRLGTSSKSNFVLQSHEYAQKQQIIAAAQNERFIGNVNRRLRAVSKNGDDLMDGVDRDQSHSDLNDMTTPGKPITRNAPHKAILSQQASTHVRKAQGSSQNEIQLNHALMKMHPLSNQSSQQKTKDVPNFGGQYPSNPSPMLSHGSKLGHRKGDIILPPTGGLPMGDYTLPPGEVQSIKRLQMQGGFGHQGFTQVGQGLSPAGSADKSLSKQQQMQMFYDDYEQDVDDEPEDLSDGGDADDLGEDFSDDGVGQPSPERLHDDISEGGCGGVSPYVEVDDMPVGAGDEEEEGEEESEDCDEDGNGRRKPRKHFQMNEVLTPTGQGDSTQMKLIQLLNKEQTHNLAQSLSKQRTDALNSYQSHEGRGRAPQAPQSATTKHSQQSRSKTKSSQNQNRNLKSSKRQLEKAFKKGGKDGDDDLDAAKSPAMTAARQKELETRTQMQNGCYQFDQNQVNKTVAAANKEFLDDDANSELQALLLQPETMTQPTGELSKKQLYLMKPPNNRIVLNYGPLPNRQPSIFFNYPPFLKIQRAFDADRIQIISQEDLFPFSYLSFRINKHTHTYNCVVNAMKTAGFHLVNKGSGPTSWNCLWTTLIRPSKLKGMGKDQKLNHFAGAWGIGSKANLWRHVQKQRRKHGKEFEICPVTYIFPEDYKRFLNDREMNNYKDMYILKPTGASCGRGIKVIGKKDQVQKRQGYLVSKYLSKPHLLRGYKYDLRIYIVVTCFEPLKAYIFKEGLVRLATQPYTTSKGSLKKRFVHLTNYSINKKSETYSKNRNTEASNLKQKNASESKNMSANTTATVKEERGEDEDEPDQVESKWSLKMLREEYERVGIDYNQVFAGIKDVCIKTLMSVEPYIVTQMRTTRHRGQCFEVYGFDVLVDANLKPWLLEVNVAPSLSSSSPYDKTVKSTLLSDTFHLLGFTIFDRKQVLEQKKKEKKRKGLGGLVSQLTSQSAGPAIGGGSQGHSIFKQHKLRTQHTINDGAISIKEAAAIANGGIADHSTKSTAMGITGSTASGATEKGQRGKSHSKVSPLKIKKEREDAFIGGAFGHQSIEPNSSIDTKSPEKFKVKDKMCIPSFLQGFDYLTEDDIEILSTYEEEQYRRSQTNLERLFPTKDTIETLGKCFESQRHANVLLWQYIRQKCPIQHLKAYHKHHK